MVRFIDDYLVVYLDRYDLARVYDLEGNLVTDYGNLPIDFESAENLKIFEENAEKWYEVSGVQYKYEKGSFVDFLLFRMYYRLIAVHENGEIVVIYQS